MARGSTRLIHKTACKCHPSHYAHLRRGERNGQEKNARMCSCGPRVVGRLDDRDYRLGHLRLGWKKSDLGEFEDKLADLRDPNRRKRADRSPLLRDWYTEWIVDMEAQVKRGNIAERTVDAYKQRWRLHIATDPVAAMPINAIGSRDLRRFVNRKAGSPTAKGPMSLRYANELVVPISGMLTDAEIEGYIGSNPARMPRRARHGATQRNTVYEQADRKPPKFLTVDDARALVLATPPTHRLMPLWVLTCGARRAEMLAARIDDDIVWSKREIQLHFQLDARRQRVEVKAGRKREAVLWSGMERLLAQKRAAGHAGFLFHTDGRALSLGAADNMMRETYRSVGLYEKGRMWHTLRHTFATYLRSQGIRWEAVEYMMGHRPRDTTGRYVHLLPEDRAAVDAALTDGFGDIVESMASPPIAAKRTT